MSEKEKLKRYDQLMLRNKGLIVKVCQVYCPNDGEKALDLFQDIALKVWTRMDTFREESAEATWLWHIAINTAIDSIRANQRRPQLVFGDTLPEIPRKHPAASTTSTKPLPTCLLMTNCSLRPGLTVSTTTKLPNRQGRTKTHSACATTELSND